MTKAEKQEFQKLQDWLRDVNRDLAMERAMRRSPFIERDLKPSDGHLPELTKGWDYNSNGDSFSVYKACSSSIYHGFGWEKTSAQRPLTMFSTEMLAMKALRYSMAEKYASNLAEVDAKIAAASEETTR